MIKMRSSREIRNDSRLIMHQNMRSILLISVGYLALTYLLSLLYSKLSGASEIIARYSDAYMIYLETGEMPALTVPVTSSTAKVLAALIYCADIVLSDGYKWYHLLRARGEKAGFMDIMPKGRFIIRLLCIEFASSLLMVIGLILFIIPGIIIYYRYRLAVYVMFDNPELGAFACMRESARLMRGNKFRLFKLDISFLGWTIAASLISTLIAPILNIWLDPYMGIAHASFYNELAARE